MAHRYRMLYRPAGYATLPDKLIWRYAELPRTHIGVALNIPVSRHLYGVIETERELTPEELRTYQIEEVSF